jgi:hypothetical protein
MSLRSDQQLQNTRRKLAELEERYEQTSNAPVANAAVRAMTLRSLKQTMNKLKEEIARYEARAHVAKNS